MRKLLALGAGLVFGLGLMISDMANPARVRAFLDLFGGWDPTLVFVMAGAMAMSFIGWRIAARRRRALFGGPLPGRPASVIDASLIGGAVLFGTGWGLVGICPGPSVVALGFGGWEFWLFFAAMVLGMALWNLSIAPLRARVVG